MKEASPLQRPINWGYARK